MKFDPLASDLPAAEIIPEVRQHLAKENTLIVHAPPGAGKSTLLPLALLDQPFLEGKKILMLEPRRLAAKSIATRLAWFLGEKVGNTVGYRIRFDTQVGENTRIEVLTEGILTRMLHQDTSLDNIGLVIFDEFHERSLFSDVALALCREMQDVLRPDLRIMIMSATLDIPKLSSLLKAPISESKGRQFPVEVLYTGNNDEVMLPELTARTVIKAGKSHEGDILVFLPGQGEIRKCEEILRAELKGFAIHPLYGTLPFHKQQQALVPDRGGKRKVVLATSIAETSLTIEGIKIVVDSGFSRISRFDPRTGLSRLVTVPITRDAADQRAGRAGRLEAGICYRMWSKATHERLAPHRTPEILESDLASLVLEMAEWNINDINQLAWLTAPPRGNVLQARDTLHELEALDTNKITDHGKKMHQLPCHPRLAHMLIKAEETDLLGLATDIAAILEERDPLPKESGIDLNLRIEALRKHRDEKRQNRKFDRLDLVASSYRRMFQQSPENGPVDDYETGFLLAQAYPERIASARPGNNAVFQLANGKLASAGHRDDLAHEAWLAVAHLDARESMGKIFMASPLNPRDLAPLVKEKETIVWDTDNGGLSATKDLRIGSIILKSTPLPSPDEKHLVSAICNALKREGQQLLDFNDQVELWQNRVLSLRKWNPAEEWPDVSTSTLLSFNEEWLSPYLQNVRTPSELRKIDLLNIFNQFFSYEKNQELSHQAPLKIAVPSGSEIKLQYFADGAPPVLAVRLQEVFGWENTPTINNGRTPLLMHLLSPGFKPVQITSDLKSFWDNTYFEVKKDLKRRYPKHAWPDDPRQEKAVRGVKRK